MDEVIKIAQLEEGINLPNGLDTLIGERGIRLSGGQKQRLVLPEHYIETHRLLYLTIASALDNITEQKLMNAIDQLSASVTVIMVRIEYRPCNIVRRLLNIFRKVELFK